MRREIGRDQPPRWPVQGKIGEDWRAGERSQETARSHRRAGGGAWRSQGSFTMTEPRFSIVIPSRNRAHTLPATLRTCLAQEFADFEILVADNCSADATAEVVNTIDDKRIRYVRSSRPLSMCDSWEFAVSHALGEYVIVVGADDGLLLHGLREIDRLLRQLNAKVLRWE